MFLFLYKSMKMVLKAIRGSHSPKQIAFGIALGMVIGLIPKDSLIAYVFGLFVFATSVNLLATSLSAFTFMWIGSVLDPISHQLGNFVLTHAWMQSTWIWLYQQPVVPWTRFNNTVVMGSLLIGLLMMLPVYLGSKTIVQKHGPGVSRTLQKFWIYRLLLGKKKRAELVGAES